MNNQKSKHLLIAKFCDAFINRLNGSKNEDFPRIMLITGPPYSGKSVLMQSIYELIGHEKSLLTHRPDFKDRLQMIRTKPMIMMDDMPRINFTMADFMRSAVCDGFVAQEDRFGETVNTPTEKTHFVLTSFSNHLPEDVQPRLVEIELEPITPSEKLSPSEAMDFNVKSITRMMKNDPSFIASGDN